MKRRNIFIGMAVLAIAVIATVNAGLNSQSKDNMSDISLATVEALAEESTNTSSCFTSVTEAPADQSLALSVRKCSTCSSVWATAASNSGKCVSQ